MEILFGAGLRQAQTDNRKKIETIAGLPEPKNYENCFTPNSDKNKLRFYIALKPSALHLQTLNLNHYLCALWQNRSKNLS